MDSNFKTPILFIIFNRPDTTIRVFNEIKKIKPTKLYIVSDGPRLNKIGEKEKCEETRKIIDLIDWQCQVFKNYSDINLGCKKRVSSGIDWFFKNEEQGIILEDDCLPDLSFFGFCEELLKKYENNDKIAMISGNHFNTNKIGEADYYFSKIPNIWGWATWRRAWQKYDLGMSKYLDFKVQDKIKNIWTNKKNRNYWRYIFEEVYNNKINTWDYQFTFSVFLNNSLCISPNFNLVSNIGFGKEFTKTLLTDKRVANLEINKVNLPLKHPKNIEYYESNDNYINKIYLKNFIIKKIFKKLGIFNIIKKVYIYLTSYINNLLNV
jgi:hypothetical protein